MLMDQDTAKALSDQQKRFMWYNHPNVRFEIVNSLRHKEMQIIGKGLSIRWLNVQHVKIWDSVRKHLHIEDRAANIYRSLDSYRMIPLMSFNLKQRQQDYNNWQDQMQSNMTGQDFGLDLDNKPPVEYRILEKIRDQETLTQAQEKEAYDLAKKGFVIPNGRGWDLTEKGLNKLSSETYDHVAVIPEVEKICELFDNYGVRYAFWMSGSHGFHFVIPYEDMPEEIKALSYQQQILFYSKLAAMIGTKCKSIDQSIYMPTRVLKCPYTLEKHGKVILPLDKQSFQDLKNGTLSLDPLTVLKNFKLGFRGIFLQGSPDGIKNLLKNWNGW